MSCVYLSAACPQLSVILSHLPSVVLCYHAWPRPDGDNWKAKCIASHTTMHGHSQVNLTTGGQTCVKAKHLQSEKVHEIWSAQLQSGWWKCHEICLEKFWDFWDSHPKERGQLNFTWNFAPKPWRLPGMVSGDIFTAALLQALQRRLLEWQKLAHWPTQVPHAYLAIP